MQEIIAAIEAKYPRTVKFVEVTSHYRIKGPAFSSFGPKKRVIETIDICSIIATALDYIKLENRRKPHTNELMPRMSKYTRVYSHDDGEVVVYMTPVTASEICAIEEYVAYLEAIADIVDSLPMPIAEEIIPHLA